MPRKSVVIRQIAHKMKSGEKRVTATTSVIGKSIKSQFRSDDFIDLGVLGQKAYPLSYRRSSVRWMRERVTQMRTAKKRVFTQKWFNPVNPVLGIVVIQPELFFRSREVLSFLREHGIEIILSRSLVFSRGQLLDVYGNRHLSQPTFAVAASRLLSGPSRVVVFKHPSKKEYVGMSRWLKHLAETHPPEHARILKKMDKFGLQGHFDQLIKGSNSSVDPGTIRAEISRKHFTSERFTRSVRDSEADALDPFHFFQRHPELVDTSLAGVHSPKDIELEGHALALLSQRELKWIDAKMSGKR
jgi:hypothetical protein